jgi:hypothetical protein
VAISRRSRTALAALAVLGLVGSTVAAAALVGGGGREDDAAAIMELRELLLDGQSSTYSARWDANLGAQGGPELEIGLTRLPPRSRSDVVVAAGDGTGELRTYDLVDETVRCQRDQQTDWWCVPAEAGAVGEAEGILGAVIAGMQRPVRAEDDQIDGRSARCFSGGDGDARTRVCLSAAGVVLAAEGSGSEVRLTDLDDEVPEGAFDLPADPDEASLPPEIAELLEGLDLTPEELTG